MLLAVEVMDPTVKMIVYGAAVACFVLAALGYTWGKVSFIAAGLALTTLPAFWDNLAVS